MDRRYRLLALVDLAVLGAWLAGPFLAAGSWAWRGAWAYLALTLAGAAAQSAYARRKNPALAQRRRRIGEGTPRWDLAWNLFFWPLMASAPVAAGLGVRHGAAAAPWWTWPLGAALFAAAMAASAWAMASNPHFEGTVRIQREVGHRVIEGGPYRRVRHPGYLGLILWAASAPLLLRSAWALPSAAATCAFVVLRTALEDAFLRRELPGYADYASRTRFRLLPGLW